MDKWPQPKEDDDGSEYDTPAHSLLGADSHHNKELPVTPEEEEKIKNTLQDLKDMLDDDELSQHVKKVILDADMIGVLTNLKSVSYLQPEIAKTGRFGFLKKKDGLNKEDLKKVEEILRRFGVEMHYTLSNDMGAEKFRSEHNIELIHVYNRSNMIESMETSKLFTNEEVEMAKENPNNFFDYMDGRVIGYSSVARMGALYGYPIEDVKDQISRENLKAKYLKRGLTIDRIIEAIQHGVIKGLDKFDMNDSDFVVEKIIKSEGVSVRGINNSVNWKTSNPYSRDVQAKIARFNLVFGIAREILGKIV